MNRQFESLVYLAGSILLSVLSGTSVSCLSLIDQTAQHIEYQLPPAESLFEESIRHLVEELSTLETQSGLTLAESLMQLPLRQREALKRAFINEHLVMFNRLLNNNLTTYPIPTYSDEQESLQAYAGATILDGVGLIIVGSEQLANGNESGTFLHLWLCEDFLHPEISNRKPRSSKTITCIDTSPHAPHPGKSVYYPCTRVVPCRNSSRFLLYVPHEIQVWKVEDSYELVYETTLKNPAGQSISADVQSLSLSPDGSYLALSQNLPSFQELLIALPQPTDSQATPPLHCNSLHSEYKGIAAWSSCGTYFVSITTDENPQRITVWKIKNGTMIPVHSYSYPCSQTVRPLSFCVSSQARFLIVRSRQPGPMNLPETFELIELSKSHDTATPLQHAPLHTSKGSINSLYDLVELSHDERYCLISPSHKGGTLVDLHKRTSLTIPSRGGGQAFLNNGHLSKGNHFILNITVSVPELISLFEPFCHLSCTELFLLYKISREVEKGRTETINLEDMYKKLTESLVSKPAATILLSQLQILRKAAPTSEQNS